MARDLIVPTLGEMGIELTTLFMMGPGPESVSCLVESVNHGLCGASHRAIAVPNEYFGDPLRFSWARSPAREAWLESGRLEIPLPRMIARIADRTREIPSPFYDIAEGRTGGLSIVERAGLSAWLRACAPLADAVLGSE